MQRTTLLRFITGSALLALAFALSAPSPVLASAPGPTGKGKTPTLIDGNPTCANLAPAGKVWRELNVDPPNSGNYSDGIINISVTISGGYVNWSADLGLDAVFVKGSSAGNLYTYDPPTEETSDTHLHTPLNSSGNPAGVSHVSFCYDLELKVTKTAQTTFTRTYNWDIRKTVSPDTLNLFRGDAGTANYSVQVTQTGSTDSAWAVSGNIAVYNPTTSSVSVTGVSDSISGGINPTANCGVSFPYTLAAKGTLNCAYSASLPDGANRTNTATATSGTANAGNGSGAAAVNFGAPTTEVNKSVTVNDTNGQSWTFSASGAQTYSRRFTCDENRGRFDNTATIRETGQSSSASVTVNCYALEVSKTATTSLTRTFRWTISKTANPTTLNMFRGDSGNVQYTVALTKDAGTDSDFAVAGAISVKNPAPIAATLNSVADVVSTGITASVTCGVSFPYSLGAGQTLSCAYSAALPDAITRANTATATLQNNTGGTTNFTGGAAVSFAGATIKQVNDSVTVNDTNGQAWTFSASGAQTYGKTFSCDANQGAHNNVATIRETTQSASASVTVNCFALLVTKDATTRLTRTFNWTINKTANPTTLDMFRGDSGNVQYNVSVTKDNGTEGTSAVLGVIRVNNPAPIPARVNNVADVISGGISASTSCDSAFPATIPAGGTLTCAYSAALPDASTRTNTATATLQNSPSGTTDFTGNASVNFSGAIVTTVNDSINVDDTNGQAWAFSASGAQTYSKTFACDADAGRKNNTATIRETGQSSSAIVAVNCYALRVTKDARTSFKRTWTWTIAKTADQTALTLALNESFLVNYKVTVNATSRDSDFAVSGTIAVVNPAPISAKINSVADVVSTGIAANVNCGVSFPYTLGAAQTLTCAYSASLPDATTRTNIATATLQNSPSGTTNFGGSAAVDFTNATKTEVDKSINVNDTLQGALGAVTASVDTLPKIFAYARTIGAYTSCGARTVQNVASFRASDSGANGSASWTVAVNVPCKGCSLTIGYWKTHAGFGPQADMVTRLLPVWLGTPSTGKSVQVTTAAQAVTLLEKSDDSSNGINKLYAQMLGAKLNLKNGADGSAIAKAITDADKLLAQYNANDWNSLTSRQKSTVIALAKTFDDYNNGLIGPGHCSQ